MANLDALFFAEDPGAANYMADLPDVMRARARRGAIAAIGPAVAYFRERNVSVITLTGSESPDDLLQRLSPRVVAAGTSENPASFGLSLIDGAKRAGIPCVGMVDGPANVAFRFRGGGESPLRHAPDWLLVPDTLIAGEFAALGFPQSRIRACGHPHWDKMRAIADRLAAEEPAALRARVFPRCPPNRKVVVFAAEISTGLDPAQYARSSDYTLRGKPDSLGRTEIVLDEFLAAVAGLAAKPYLVLRLHPKHAPGDLAAYRGDFDLVSVGGMPHELLQAADVVAGMSSMLLQEAVLMHKSTLSILPRASEAAWLPTIAMGDTPCAFRKEEIPPLLERILAGWKPIPPQGGYFAGAGNDCAGAIADFLAGLSTHS